MKNSKKYQAVIDNRIEQVGCRVRSDSVKFIDTKMTASPEFFKGRAIKDTEQFFNRAAEFLKAEVGQQNIFSVNVDTLGQPPRMHLLFIPLTEDNRLSAKEIIGNRRKLIEWQDKFYKYMSAFYPELERKKS